MLNRYNDFLFESLMLESVLVYSDGFKEILKDVDSPVSKALLDIESQDLTLANNYIDITDNKEEISFIQDRKAQEILKPEFLKKIVYYVGSGGFLKHSEGNQEMFDMLEYQTVGDKCYHPQIDEKGEVQKRATSTSSGKVYLKVKYPGGITVVDEQKVRYEDAEKLPFILNRQKIRVGRGIRGILGSATVSFKDTEIEEFVNKYKSAIDKKNDVFKNFELVKGQTIAKWYDVNNYQLGHTKGTLSTSCMRSVPSKYFSIYTTNEDVCSLLILKTDDGQKIKGRALVWNLESPEGITYMDRTYVHEDSDFELFRQYAQKKGWYRKPHNNHYVSSEMIDPNGNAVNKGDELVVRVKKGEYSYYPYLDTIKYLDTYSGRLSTQGGSNTIELSDTGGGFVGGEGDCDYCGGDGEVDCPECSGNGDWGCNTCYLTGEVDCNECDGSGSNSCGECDGDGDVECEDCSGSGEDEEGEECGNCEGKGRHNCEDCDGEGSKECGDCSGSGKQECDDCDGNGRIECEFCYGNGMMECPECG